MIKAFEVFRDMQKGKLVKDSVIYNTLLDGALVATSSHWQTVFSRRCSQPTFPLAISHLGSW